MKWTVVWLPEALDDLASLYLVMPDQGAVTQAASWIEERLARDPENLGVVAPDGQFIERDPLSVAFEIIPDDCMVRVLQVVASG